ncbi:hypothetical protein O0L34_g18498 [Tuta absoluta]|nr:hypothetical protein O0L34_g18498 [Tuta absoluta]
MYSIIVLFLFGCSNIAYSQNDWTYTEQAYTTEGQPCLTNCIDGECFIDWEYTTGKCVKTGVKPPRYLTVKGTYCVSNCGFFGTFYEWCNTDEYYRKWEQCNSKEESVSTFGRKCEGSCRMGSNGYYWCAIANSWQYCALPREKRKESDDSEEINNFSSVEWSHKMDPEPDYEEMLYGSIEEITEFKSEESLLTSNAKPDSNENISPSKEAIDGNIPESISHEEITDFKEKVQIELLKYAEEMYNLTKQLNKTFYETDSNKETNSSEDEAYIKNLQGKLTAKMNYLTEQFRKKIYESDLKNEITSSESLDAYMKTQSYAAEMFCITKLLNNKFSELDSNKELTSSEEETYIDILNYELTDQVKQLTEQFYKKITEPGSNEESTFSFERATDKVPGPLYHSDEVNHSKEDFKVQEIQTNEKVPIRTIKEDQVPHVPDLNKITWPFKAPTDVPKPTYYSEETNISEEDAKVEKVTMKTIDEKIYPVSKSSEEVKTFYTSDATKKYYDVGGWSLVIYSFILFTYLY